MKNKNFGRKRQAIYILSNRKSTRIIKTLMDFFFFIKVKIKMVCFSVPSLIDRGIFIIFFVAFWDSILYFPETMQLIIFYVILLIEIAIKSKRKTEVTIMEFKSILIKDTTVEERKQIVKESLGNISASCDGCMARLSEMYGEYIEGKKEIRDINMEFNGHYLRGDMDKGERRSCPM